MSNCVSSALVFSCSELWKREIVEGKWTCSPPSPNVEIHHIFCKMRQVHKQLRMSQHCTHPTEEASHVRPGEQTLAVHRDSMWARDTSCNKGNCNEIPGNKRSLGRRSNTGTSYPEKLWNICPWRYSDLSGQGTWCKYLCVEQGFGPNGWPFEWISFPNCSMLFYESIELPCKLVERGKLYTHTYNKISFKKSVTSPLPWTTVKQMKMVFVMERSAYNLWSCQQSLL